MVPYILCYKKRLQIDWLLKMGTKDNSILTNLVGFNFRAEKCFDIKPESFEPAPKVTSSFIKLTRHKDYD